MTTKRAYVLRTCDANLKSHNDFQWPEKGEVSCPDWDPKPECGNGLHGLLNGKDKGSYLLDWDLGAKWLVVSVNPKDIVDLDDKVKFKEGIVVHCGDRKSATDFIISKGADPSKVAGAFLTGGDKLTVTGGYSSTVTGGHDSTVTGGDESTVTGGHFSTVTGGYYSTATGGDESTVTGGHFSTVTGGRFSTVTGGYGSTVTGGESSTVIGELRSTVTGGNRSSITGGYDSTVTGGHDSVLSLKWWDSKANRLRISTVYVGEDGILPDIEYKLDNKGKFIKANNDETYVY